MAKTKPIVRPGKPYVGFPLFPHASGRWAKKVRGRFAYFGKWADDQRGERALALYLDEKDTLAAGRRPRRKGELGPSIVDLVSDFLDAKEKRVASGELTLRSFVELKGTCDLIVENFGRRTLVVDLTPHDFERLRARMALTLGPVRLLE